MADNNYKKSIAGIKQEIDNLVTSMRQLDDIVMNISANSRTALSNAQQTSNVQEFTSALQQQKTQINQLNSELDKLKKKDDQLAAAKRRLNQITSEEIVNQKILARNAKEQAILNSKLVGEYRKLVTQRDIAKRKLLDLMAAENKQTLAIKKAKAELAQYETRLRSANAAVGQFGGRTMVNSANRLRSLGAAFGYAGAAYIAADLARKAFNLTKKLESLDFALRTVETSMSNQADIYIFLDRITEAYGANLVTTTERFTKFWAAAKQSNVSLQDTKQIFESVTKAAGVLGLKTDELTGIYLALEQMLSKGKITTEELRRQLGERLPGAFGIMADALGVTVPKLDEMLRKGEVMSAEVLPKFAVALEKAYSIENVERVETLAAATERLENNWIQLVKTITTSEGILGGALKGSVDLINEVLKGMNLILDPNGAVKNAEALGSAIYDKTYKKQLEYLRTLKKENGEMADIAGKQAAAAGMRYLKIKQEVEALKERQKAIDESGDYKGNALMSTATGMEYKQNKDRLAELIPKMQTQLAIMDAAKKASLESFGIEKKRLDLNKEDEKDTKKKKAGIDAVAGSIAYLQKEIKKLEELQSKTATDKSTFQTYEEQIKALKEQLRLLIREFYGMTDVEAQNLIPEDMADMIVEIEGNMEGLIDAHDRWNDKWEETAKKIDVLKDVFKTVTDTFSNIYNIDTSKFDFIFESFKFQDDSLFDIKYLDDWGQVAQTSIEGVLNASMNRYQIELQEAVRTRDLIVNNELATEEQKRAARLKYEREEAKIRTERAKKERDNNLIRIAMDTAVGIMKTIAEMGFIPALPFLPAIAALGATQAAIVASQELPKFQEGTTNAPEGLGIIDEVRPEVHTDKRGNIKSTGQKGGARLTYFEKGDKVFKSHDAFLKHMLDEIGISTSTMWGMSNNQAIINKDTFSEAILRQLRESGDDANRNSKRIEQLAKRPVVVINKLDKPTSYFGKT